MYTHEDTVRMRTAVNYIIKNGGELILPQLTELAAKRSPCLDIYGAVFGVRELRVYASARVQLHINGHSGCFNCASKYNGNGLDRKYWFKQITVKAGGTFEVISSVQNVNDAVQIYTGGVALEYNGVIKSDAVEMFSKYVKVDHDGRFDSSGRVSTSGPGTGGSCASAGGGAGHGGNGGRGADCHCSGTYASGKPRFYQSIYVILVALVHVINQSIGLKKIK